MGLSLVRWMVGFDRAVDCDWAACGWLGSALCGGGGRLCIPPAAAKLARAVLHSKCLAGRGVLTYTVGSGWAPVLLGKMASVLCWSESMVSFMQLAG